MYRVLQNNHLLRDYPDLDSAQNCVRSIVAGYLRNRNDILSVFCGIYFASVTFQGKVPFDEKIVEFEILYLK